MAAVIIFFVFTRTRSMLTLAYYFTRKYYFLRSFTVSNNERGGAAYIAVTLLKRYGA